MMGRMEPIVIPPLYGDAVRVYTATCYACPHTCHGTRVYVVGSIRAHVSACHGLLMREELN